MDREDNPLKHAPHTAPTCLADEWTPPYSLRLEAAYPAGDVDTGGQILAAGIAHRQCRRRSQPGLLLPAAVGIRPGDAAAGGGVSGAGSPRGRSGRGAWDPRHLDAGSPEAAPAAGRDLRPGCRIARGCSGRGAWFPATRHPGPRARCRQGERPWSFLSRREVVRNRHLNLDAEVVQTGAGAVLDPYWVMAYPDWVLVVALTADDRLVLALGNGARAPRPGWSSRRAG